MNRTRKHQLPRADLLAALPAEAPAADLHHLVCRKASDALYDHLRAEQWVRNHARKTYDADEHAVRHARLQAEAKAARKARTLWARAEDASQDALYALPRDLRSTAYTAAEWANRCQLLK